MERIRVIFRSVENVVDFVRDAEKLDVKLCLLDKNIYLDARSILGILSMDLKRPLTLEIDGNKDERDNALEVLSGYLAD